MSHTLTRHDLYELCVQSPKHLVPFLRAVHGGEPRVLGEDFAGTAALSRLWADASPESRAIAVDLDGDALGYHADHPRVAKREANVLEVSDPADVIFVGNFSIGYWHTRVDLVAYLRHVHKRLSSPVTDGGGGPPTAGRRGSSRTNASGLLQDPPSASLHSAPPPSAPQRGPAEGTGLFLCDTYGGESAFLIGGVHRDHWIPKEDRFGEHAGKRIRYTWEQRHADPLTGMVTDVLHFRVESGGTIELELDEAFVYEWRLWSVPELRDAMLEAGFVSTEVYAKTGNAVDDEGNVYVLPVEDAEEELDDSFIVMVAART
ncbi:MAG: hypothetical protein H6810_00320 [Phycisphaeraceae bacterium]|nr:MAG: hypothetical protein H6810_00320 [Phycisphaeraceae bacterium]